MKVKRGTLHVAKTWPDEPVLAAARLETKLEPALDRRAVYERAGTEIGGQLTEPAHDINGSRTTSLQSEIEPPDRWRDPNAKFQPSQFHHKPVAYCVAGALRTTSGEGWCLL